MRSPTFYLMLSVAVGAIIGLIMPHSSDLGPGLLSFVQVLGHLWLNGLKMTLVPLVFSFMVTGTAGLFSHRNGGALMLTAVILFEIILLNVILWRRRSGPCPIQLLAPAYHKLDR